MKPLPLAVLLATLGWASSSSDRSLRGDGLHRGNKVEVQEPRHLVTGGTPTGGKKYPFLAIPSYAMDAEANVSQAGEWGVI
jgi:hypothetical protein